MHFYEDVRVMVRIFGFSWDGPDRVWVDFLTTEGIVPFTKRPLYCRGVGYVEEMGYVRMWSSLHARGDDWLLEAFSDEYIDLAPGHCEQLERDARDLVPTTIAFDKPWEFQDPGCAFVPSGAWTDDSKDSEHATPCARTMSSFLSADTIFIRREYLQEKARAFDERGCEEVGDDYPSGPWELVTSYTTAEYGPATEEPERPEDHPPALTGIGFKPLWDHTFSIEFSAHDGSVFTAVKYRPTPTGIEYIQEVDPVSDDDRIGPRWSTYGRVERRRDNPGTSRRW
jgi:hypothetical protein